MNVKKFTNSHTNTLTNSNPKIFLCPRDYLLSPVILGENPLLNTARWSQHAIKIGRGTLPELRLFWDR